MLKDRRITKSEKIKGAQGLEVGPAGRKRSGGRARVSVCQAVEIREGKWLGDRRKRIQISDRAEAGNRIGNRRNEGGLNWSNRFGVIR